MTSQGGGKMGHEPQNRIRQGWQVELKVFMSCIPSHGFRDPRPHSPRVLRKAKDDVLGLREAQSLF